MALINCPKCEKQISDTVKTCIHCGAEFTVCPECKTVLEGTPSVCSNCGFLISEPKQAEQPKTSEISSDAEINEEGSHNQSVEIDGEKSKDSVPPRIEQNNGQEQKKKQQKKNKQQKPKNDMFSILKSFEKKPASKAITVISTLDSVGFIVFEIILLGIILLFNGFLPALFSGDGLVLAVVLFIKALTIPAIVGVIRGLIIDRPISILENLLAFNYLKKTGYDIQETVKRLAVGKDDPFRHLSYDISTVDDFVFFTLFKYDGSGRFLFILKEVFDTLDDTAFFAGALVGSISMSLVNISSYSAGNVEIFKDAIGGVIIGIVIMGVGSVCGFIKKMLEKSCKKRAVEVIVEVSKKQQ